MGIGEPHRGYLAFTLFDLATPWWGDASTQATPCLGDALPWRRLHPGDALPWRRLVLPWRRFLLASLHLGDTLS